MKQIRKRLTYANVMSTIAVFLALAGASAFAATQLGKNTVGTKQLKNNAVTAAKIKKEAVSGAKVKAGAVSGPKIAGGAVTTEKLGDNAVTTSKIADGVVTNGKLAANSVTGDKIKDGSVTGSDVNQGTLNGVKAANVFATGFDVGPNTLVNPSDPGIKAGGCFFVCVVEFPRDVSTCSATASSIGPEGGTGEPAMAEVFPSGSDKNSLLVVMWDDEGNITGHDFGLTVVCPSTS